MTTPATQREADDFEPVWNEDFPSGSCPTCGFPEKKHGCTCPPVTAPEARAATDQPSAGQVDERAQWEAAKRAEVHAASGIYIEEFRRNPDGRYATEHYEQQFRGWELARASLTPTAPQADPNQRVRDYESGVMQGVAEERAARFARECAAQAAPAVATAEVFALYRAVNELMAHLGAHGEIDARHDLSDAVMAALHGLDGDKVAQRVEDLVEKAFMPRDQATRLAVSEYITCNESTAPQAASQQAGTSIDHDPEFQRLAEAWRAEPYGTRGFLKAWDAMIAYIDRHAPQAATTASAVECIRAIAKLDTRTVTVESVKAVAQRWLREGAATTASASATEGWQEQYDASRKASPVDKWALLRAARKHAVVSGENLGLGDTYTFGSDTLARCVEQYLSEKA